MLLFIDNPVGLLILFALVLILFGPQKVPEIANQLGRAIRELKRATSDFTSAMNTDDHHTPTYDPPRYDQQSSVYSSASHTPDPHGYETNAISGGAAIYDSQTGAYKGQAAITGGTASSGGFGDHAASALAGGEETGNGYSGQSAHNAAMTAPITSPPPSGDVYGVVTNGAPAASDSTPLTVRPAEGAVPRQTH